MSTLQDHQAPIQDAKVATQEPQRFAETPVPNRGPQTSVDLARSKQLHSLLPAKGSLPIQKARMGFKMSRRLLPIRLGLLQYDRLAEGDMMVCESKTPPPAVPSPKENNNTHEFSSSYSTPSSRTVEQQ